MNPAAGLADFEEAEARVAASLAQDGWIANPPDQGQARQEPGQAMTSDPFRTNVGNIGNDLADDGFSPVSYVIEEIEDGDELLGAFRDLGMVLSRHPRETSLGKRTWVVRCPWEEEHTARGDTGAAYAAGGAFKCHHGHCETRHIGELWARMDELLGAESAGLDTLAARGLGVVDPVSVPIPAALEAVARRLAEAEARGVRRPARAYVADKLTEFWVDWGYLQGDDRMVERSTGDTMSRASFDLVWTPILGPRGLNVLPLVGVGKAARSMSPGAWYLTNTDQRMILAGTTWEPGPGQLVRQVDGRVLLNRWKALPRPLELAPERWVDEIAVAPWKALVAHVLDNNAAAVALVLDWLAMVLGVPGIKPGFHILLIGGQGIGKELMVLPLTVFLGPERSTTVSAEEIGSGFTGWICNRLVLMAELRQTTRGALTGHDRYGALKTLLDNGKAYLPVNPKYGKPFNARNVAAVWATSNEDRPLDLEKDDRRFWVHTSQAAPWALDAYTRLVRWMEKPAWEPNGPTGIERVCEHLLRRWDRMPGSRKTELTGRAPMTQSKADLIALSDTPWEDYLSDIQPDVNHQGGVASLHPLNELVTALEVSQRMLHALRAGDAGLPPHLRLPSLKAIGQMLKRRGAVLTCRGNQVRIPGGERSRVWDLSPGRVWRLADSTAVAGAIMAMRRADQHNKLQDDFGDG